MIGKKKTAQDNGSASGVATGLPLFYKKPVMLDKQQHAEMSLSSKMSFAFAANVNAVPINMVELPHVMQFYPIAFSIHSPATPLAILGLRENENLFVNKKGEWLENTYIPAYIRRYPFIFAQESDRLTLCVDDQALEKNKKNPIFTPDGELTAVTSNALEFCRSYQAAAEQTTQFAQIIEQSGILIDRHAEARLADGSVMTLSGFRQIDEAKYYELPEATLMEWHRNHLTGFIYAHLFSSANWQRLFQLVETRLKK